MVLQNYQKFTEVYLVHLLGTTNMNVEYLLTIFCLFTIWAFLKDKSFNSVQNTPLNFLPIEVSKKKVLIKKEFPNKKKNFQIKRKRK